VWTNPDQSGKWPLKRTEREKKQSVKNLRYARIYYIISQTRIRQ